MFQQINILTFKSIGYISEKSVSGVFSPSFSAKIRKTSYKCLLLLIKIADMNATSQ